MKTSTYFTLGRDNLSSISMFGLDNTALWEKEESDALSTNDISQIHRHLIRRGEDGA